MNSDIQHLTVSDGVYPTRLVERLGPEASPRLRLLGNPDLLGLPKTALFCSVRCPGNAILAAYDKAARWRDERRCVISGFHSPVEKECLRILLRGSPPTIICPARGLPRRIPAGWRKPLDEGGLLILSAFPEAETRITADLARRRNDLVAALADEVWFAHVTPGGNNDMLTGSLVRWRVPFSTGKTS